MIGARLEQDEKRREQNDGERQYEKRRGDYDIDTRFMMCAASSADTVAVDEPAHLSDSSALACTRSKKQRQIGDCARRPAGSRGASAVAVRRPAAGALRR